jgi:DNA modification methylase
MRAPRRPTSTSPFGVGRRESHDARGFYTRFSPPVVTSDQAVTDPAAVDRVYVGDSRRMVEVADGSVALMVTSPPYFAGKEYEADLGRGHVPASYLDYLELLTDVFAEATRKLEPGGRMAVNVANLGRRPYRSLAADVTTILQDRLGLLLRGEVVWLKARGAAGSCAWGSFQSPVNPVLRDITERVVIASKGRFDRAVARAERRTRGLPFEASVTRDEFLEATLDVWEIPAESAVRVGHPAPFPVGLPQRLIELYTWRDDLVLDPFLGSGATAVAAVRTGRRFVGYDTEESYVATAQARVAAERNRPAGESDVHPADPVRQARAEGRQASDVARTLLEASGFTVVGRQRLAPGVEVELAATDRAGRSWHFEVSGGFTTTRSGLSASDSLWRGIGRATVLRAVAPDVPVVLLTTAAPPAAGPNGAALAAVRPHVVFDVVELLSEDDRRRLADYANGDVPRRRPGGGNP